ncbi:hypothetical protein C8J56DRAFT_898668 [Mycena floridula]|nr:hypothetical protein C8J56DRAFT_898668 [Mycena floridula]
MVNPMTPFSSQDSSKNSKRSLRPTNRVETTAPMSSISFGTSSTMGAVNLDGPTTKINSHRISNNLTCRGGGGNRNQQEGSASPTLRTQGSTTVIDSSLVHYGIWYKYETQYIEASQVPVFSITIEGPKWEEKLILGVQLSRQLL